MEANEGFPKTNLQLGLSLSYGKYNHTQDNLWAKWLNFPKTGLTASIYDFGNSEKIGRAYTLMPFMEFKISNKLNLNTGLGLSYMDTLFDAESNPFNRAVTTKFNWSFKSFFYYDLFKSNNIDWRFGLGYVHHSNGHTRLPNQGLNSFLASISAKIDSKTKNRRRVFSTRQNTYTTNLFCNQNWFRAKCAFRNI